MDRAPRTASGRLSLLAHAGFGVLATLAGAAAGHLIAAALLPGSSPVLAVSAAVIDRTPTPMKEWAIREFGDRDKVILLGSVLAATLLLGALAGALSRRSPRAGAGVLLGLVAVAGAAAVTRPDAGATSPLPAIVTAAVGVGTLLALARIARGGSLRHKPRATLDPATPATPATPAATRRTLLRVSATVAVLTAAGGVLGEWLHRLRASIVPITLPAPSDPAPPLPVGLEKAFGQISDFQTSSGDFYRVDINLSLPIVQAADWSLRIDGDVERPYTLTFDELAALPLIERDITLTCVSNEVGGKYVGAARWLGVPVKALLERAGVRDGADQLYSTAEDGFTISTPLAAVLDGRDAMVAIGMNGEPLPAEHGFPARLVTPGLYGYVGATKWLRRMTVTTYADKTAYWTDRGWAIDAPIKISSRIDTPRPLARVPAGRVPIGGVAWAQQRGIGAVEVQVDDGPWQRATLGPDAGVDYWRQWYLLWDAEPGRHTLAVRALTETGELQTAARARPFPEGSSGIQAIQITVT